MNKISNKSDEILVLGLRCSNLGFEQDFDFLGPFSSKVLILMVSKGLN